MRAEHFDNSVDEVPSQAGQDRRDSLLHREAINDISFDANFRPVHRL